MISDLLRLYPVGKWHLKQMARQNHLCGKPQAYWNTMRVLPAHYVDPTLRDHSTAFIKPLLSGVVGV